MWAPADITAMPTANELIDAKIAIEHIETELNDALQLLEQVQLRVANLERNLRERRAWIAPIRRLSYDVLSLIFEFCGEDNWRTPLRISGVSRLWKTLVLATPRAWAFLNVHECDGNDDDLIHHFFQHCGQRPLHVFLSPSQHLTILPDVTERLECLSVEDQFQIEEIQVFPRLRHLSLRSVDEHIGLSELCIARFPALRELICEEGIVMSLPGSMRATFPPLQILSVTIEESPASLDLLIGCRSSLVSLRLHVIAGYAPSKSEVLLPLLRCLEIHIWYEYPDIWPLYLKTPAIETYMERSEWGTPPTAITPIHSNVENATRMRIFYAPCLSSMSSLRTLQLGSGVRIADVLSQLQANRSLCPRLETIELFRVYNLAPYETSIFEVNRERSQPISIRSVATWGTPLPYEISRFPCGPDMPCSGK